MEVGRSASTRPLCRIVEAARVGGAADDGEIQLPFAEDALGQRPREPGFSTISMRSWLSESIIS